MTRARQHLALALFLLAAPAAPARAADLPPSAALFSTFSICAIDPATGESGVAVTTRVPFVGRAVPWVRAGVGAVATQSWTEVEYGPRGLDLLAQGKAPEQVIATLLAGDAGRELRQLGVIDMQGRTASFTGAENGAWAGSRAGLHYVVQGNILVGPQVVAAVAASFEATAGLDMPLAERLILALRAGHATGGDKRWGSLQSAALRIADPHDPGRGGDHISLAIDVGEHAEPAEELYRIYRTTQRRLGYRSFSRVAGPDVVELHRMLHALGHFHPEVEVFPEAPKLGVEASLLRTDPTAFQAGVAAWREANGAFEKAWGTFGEDSVAAVDAFRQAHDLAQPGYPAGLVDERLVAALRAAFHARHAEPAPPSPEPG
jgi:uncharacterized Ntn-hydrolase superfamily protein